MRYDRRPVVNFYENFDSDWRYHWSTVRHTRFVSRLHSRVKWVRVHEHGPYGLNSSTGRSDIDRCCRFTSRKLERYPDCYSFPDGFIVPYIPELPFFMAHIETEQIDQGDYYDVCVGLDVSTWSEIHAYRRCGSGMSGGFEFPNGYKLAVETIERFALVG